jgi:hypothetical protein
MRRVRGLLFGVFLAALGPTRIARAQAPGGEREPIQVQVDGSTSCLSEARFFEQVQARTPRVRRAEAGEAARTFDVGVKPEGGSFVGRLVVVEPTGPTEPRVVRASSCDEATSALALIAAVSIDARASTAPAPAPTSLPAPEARATPMESATTPPPGGPTRTWSFAAGGSTDPLTIPTPGIGFGAFVGVGLDGPGVFTPELRLAGARTEGSTVNTSAGSGQPIWLTLDLSFCPVHSARHVLAACADFEGGTLQVDTSAAGASSRSRPWLAPGLGGRLSVPDVSLASRLQLLLELEVGLRVPLVRDTFYFFDNPSNFQVYEAPVLMAHAAIDVGLRFW